MHHSENSATDEELELEAIDLVAKLETSDASAAKRLRASAWRAQSPRHERAWSKAEKAWGLMGELTPPARAGIESHPWQRRIRTPHAALAAGVGAVALALALAVVLQRAPLESARSVEHDPRTQASERTQRFTAAAGSRRSVTLDDGSAVHLNSGTVIEARFEASSRRVDLLRGEAVFDVAKDSTRPFSVAVDATQATATGTVFMVRRLPERAARVTVLEGRVIVAAASGASIELGMDQAVEISATALGQPLAVNAENAAAWRRGVLIFRDDRLDHVVAEIGRYTPYRIEAELGGRGADKVTGTFFIDRSDESLSALAGSFDLVATPAEAGVLHLTPARPKRPSL